MTSQKISYISAAKPETSETILFEEQLAGLDYDIDVHVCTSEGEIIEAVKGADVIVNRGVAMPRNIIEQIDSAQAIVSLGHGFDRIDHYAATDNGIMVVNSAGFCTEEVANHAMMLLLASAKKLTFLNETLKSGNWDNDTRSNLNPLGTIDGQTLGLVSFGNIARAVARRAQAFGLRVIAYDPYIPSWIAKEYRVELVSTLRDLAENSDYISAHVPLNKETGKMMDSEFFNAMKPNAYFINTCRGGTVDEEALIQALQAGKIAGAGLDVFAEEPTSKDNPLLKMDNVIVTPHSAGTSEISFQTGFTRMGQETANLIKGRSPMSLVNPEVRSSIAIRPAARHV